MKVLVVPFLRAQIQNSSDMDSLQQTSMFFFPQVLQFQSKRMLRGSAIAAAVQVIWVLRGRGKSHFVIVLCSGALIGQKSVASRLLLVRSLLLCGGSVSNMGIWWEWFRSLAVQVAATPLAMLFCQPATLCRLIMLQDCKLLGKRRTFVPSRWL